MESIEESVRERAVMPMYRTKCRRALWDIYVVVSSIVWGIYAVLANLVWASYACYLDPKYGPIQYVVFLLFSVLHILLAGWYFAEKKMSKGRPIALCFMACFFLLFGLELFSVSLYMKMMLAWSTARVLGLLCLTGVIIYLSRFLPNVLLEFWEKHTFWGTKIFLLSAIEAIVLIYFQTLVAINETEGVFAWIVCSDALPNIGVIFLLAWFWGILIPDVYREINKYSKTGNRNTVLRDYSKIYFSLSLLLLLGVVLQVNVFELQPKPLWIGLLPEKWSTVWNSIIAVCLDEKSRYIFIGMIPIALLWLKKQIERKESPKKASKITMMAASLLLALSTHMFLGTLLYTALVSEARARNYPFSPVTWSYGGASIPKVLAYLFVWLMLLLVNYYFWKETEKQGFIKNVYEKIIKSK